MFSQDLIITTYNSFEYCNLLSRNIIKLSQFYDNIIVVDDYSEDNTYDFLYAKLFEIKNIKLIKNNSNLGPSLSRNLGVKYAISDYISFLDADDIFCYKKYKVIKEFCNLHSPEILFHSYKIIKNREFTSNKSKNNYKIHKNHLYLFKSLYVTPAFTIKRKTFLKEKGYDPKLRYAEDLELYIRLRKKYNFFFLNHDLVGVYKSNKSLSSNRRKMRINIIKILFRELSIKKLNSLIFSLAIFINLCKIIINK